jgi:hypothetical protein
MRYVTLTSINDPETGELGLKIDGVPAIDYPMAASEGLLIAHDLLEHQQGLRKIGTIGDELIACGGIWYVRGQHADIRRDSMGSMYGSEENVAADVSNMGRMYVQGCMLHSKVPSRLPACAADESIRDILRYSAKGMIDEFQACGESLCHEERKRMAKYLRMSEILMRKGYNMARRRFERGERSRYYANSMFWEIAQAVDPYCKHLEYEGQRFRLAYGGYEAHCKEIHDEEEYY